MRIRYPSFLGFRLSFGKSQHESPFFVCHPSSLIVLESHLRSIHAIILDVQHLRHHLHNSSLFVLVLRKRYSNRRLGTLYDFYLDIQSVTAAFTPLYLSRGLRIEPGLQHKPFVRPYLKRQSAKRSHKSDHPILLKDCFSTSHRSMTVP